MKIIGHQGDGYLASVTKEEIAILLGFRGQFDDDFKAWMRLKTGGDSKLSVGTEVQVGPVGDFWRNVLYRENEIATAAKTMRALADLITTNLPSGIIVPPVAKTEEDKS